ncbi:FKBP-type peptidyl-prolyl cis-trans isomerase [Candidatus Kaiserbacteria bacterium]|nr:FKBP-type peptidyl-prolyl cis-trans isomerase [Candidatus Kaiserbacteria bacterium]
MAVALAIVRFYPEKGLALFSNIEPQTQVGSIVVADTDTSGLPGALRDAASLDGELQRLVVEDIRIGIGAAAVEGDTVTVDYVGSTQDGVQFDNSYQRGEPFTFTLGERKVIPGWEQGILGMRTGGQRVLVVPADLAYGDYQVGPIKAGSTLVFAVELLAIE